MQTKIFKEIKGRRGKINFLFDLAFFLLSCFISFSLLGCGSGSSPNPTGIIGGGNGGGNIDPVADFTVTPDVGAGVASFTEFYFDASGSHDPDGMITYYEWDFENDGTFDAAGPNLATVPHTYDIPGQKTALLRVTDDDDKKGINETIMSIVVLPSWEVTNGPFSGSISSLAIDPTNSGVVYSTTRKSEVYQRTDGGSRWAYFPTKESETQENISVQELKIAPTDNQVFYLGTGSQGMYKSTDGGETWVHISNGLLETQYGYLSVDQILVDPTSSNTVYVRLDMGYRLYKTTNGGQSWSEIYNGESDLDVVKDLVIDPTNSDVIYIGQKKKGVWKSIDGGQNWTPKNNGLPSDLGGEINITELAIDHQEPFRVYAGTFDFGVCRTDNGGESWGYLEIFPGTDYQEILSLEVDPKDQFTIYVGMNDRDDSSKEGLWVTTDGGWNWTQYFPYESVGSIKIAPSDSMVFVNGFDDTWYTSPPTGVAWQQVDFTGIQDLRTPALSQIIPDGSILYGGTEEGVYRTTDGGDTWESKSQGLENTYIYTLVMHPTDNQRIYVGTINGVYLTTDGGENWAQKNNGLTNNYVYVLAMDATSSEILYAGTERGIFKTIDGGENWVEKSYGLPFTYNSVWRLAVAPNDHSVLYASVQDYFGTWQEKTYKSTDGGESWEDASGALPTDQIVWGIAISPTDNNVVYIGIDGYGVYKTGDGGATWELKNGGLTSTNVKSLAISQGNDEIVFAGTEGEGVFATIDGGENWIQIDQGLTTELNKRIYSLAMDVRDIDNPVIYAGTGCGVFKAYK